MVEITITSHHLGESVWIFVPFASFTCKIQASEPSTLQSCLWVFFPGGKTLHFGRSQGFWKSWTNMEEFSWGNRFQLKSGGMFFFEELVSLAFWIPFCELTYPLLKAF